MDYDSCIGCGYCAVSCPYQARTIVHEERGYYGAPTRQETQTRHADRIAVANKCTFCVGRIDEAQERGLTPGVDLDVTPACAAARFHAIQTDERFPSVLDVLLRHGFATGDRSDPAWLEKAL